ncbi:hypothetical protein V5O48_002725 [Marasmius crinis-equi]|uniref:Uncharacterized protein n=1 Tax=Marasmius crinis-equi TaxID=585013 RepID=A0ABR3FUT8_9AGAR
MQNRPFAHWFILPSVFLALYIWVSVCFKTPKLFLSTVELSSGPQIGRNRSTSPGATHADILQHSPQISDGVFTVSENELTVIIPVDEPNLLTISSTLSHFESPFLRQVLLLCPESISLQVEASLKDLIVSGKSFSHATYSVISRRVSGGLTDAMIQAMSTQSISNSNWILVSDEHGLEGIQPSLREQLLRPPPIDYPTGPRGIRLSSHHSTCLSPSSSFQTASYLVPPFVIPANLLRGLRDNPRTWLELGEIVSNCLPGEYGGLVSPVLDIDAGENQNWCPLNTSSTGSLGAFEMANNTMILGAPTDIWKKADLSADVHRRGLVFVSIFSILEELRLFAPIVCSLQSRGIRVYSLLDTLYDSLPGTIRLESCMLSYETSLEVLSELDPGSTVLVTTPDLGHHLEGATNIRIPRGDLVYCSWMTSLTEAEWRDWHRPQLTISVITKDRPASLARLLTSISNGLYFGDQVDMRIYLEQSADYETMQTVKQHSWSHGSLFVHHRIIHGGLLPAVVESWYPHTNDSYGLLLEDDVELSPLFYAWIKMSLLRYGAHIGSYPNLFGISLYQQKSIELHPEGRKPFNASHLFFESNFPPSTPYLSQTPCSWGAVYFPEHWSEFHDYLAIRFSEMAFKIDEIVVPDVRSNRWTKSWKKFFIELVYLRGYVMLYPNFPDYMSLSTNHLEVGSHVKVRSQAKRDAFVVPLMQLPMNDRQSLGILDMPDGTLPTNPPVLNLTGSLSTLYELDTIGLSRRAEMLHCEVQEGSDSNLFDARSLLCVS